MALPEGLRRLFEVIYFTIIGATSSSPFVNLSFFPFAFGLGLFTCGLRFFFKKRGYGQLLGFIALLKQNLQSRVHQTPAPWA